MFTVTAQPPATSHRDSVMVTLAFYDPRFPVPLAETTYCEPEWYGAAAAALRRGSAYEAWRDGRLIARGGPYCSLPLRYAES